MSDFHLSVEADEDILEIARFSIEIWGLQQSLKYKEELHNCFKLLAKNPEIGRNASFYSPSLKRYSYKAHTIFFKEVVDGIFIVRILGQRMDFESHL